jgi:hypothetical protein
MNSVTRNRQNTVGDYAQVCFTLGVSRPRISKTFTATNRQNNGYYDCARLVREMETTNIRLRHRLFPNLRKYAASAFIAFSG